MNMLLGNWTSWSAFWDMGGYGLYVWGSMGAVLAALAVEHGGLRRRRRDALAQIIAAKAFAPSVQSAARVPATPLEPAQKDATAKEAA